MIKVNLTRAFAWRDEDETLHTYGPGEGISIPKGMAEGLVKGGKLPASVLGPQPPDPAKITLEELRTIKGVSKTSIKAIEEYYQLPSEDSNDSEPEDNDGTAN